MPCPGRCSGTSLSSPEWLQLKAVWPASLRGLYLLSLSSTHALAYAPCCASCHVPYWQLLFDLQSSSHAVAVAVARQGLVHGRG